MAKKVWYKAAEVNELPEGRVKQVSCGLQTVCLTKFKGEFAALSNKCPHQGGPLGEGSIENGLLRCPWHGWDFDPITGKPPGGYDDGVPTYDLEIREDGIYVAIEEEDAHVRTTSDVMVETMVHWGVDTVFGMVGHSNLGFADALRLQSEAGALNYYGIRHEGAAAFAASAYGKLTGRPAACFSIAGPGATNLLTGLWDANVDSAPVLALTGQVPSNLIGRGAFQEVDLVGAFGKVAVWSTQVSVTSPHAELMTLACKHAILETGVSHIVLPDEVQTIASDAPADTPEGRMPLRDIAPAQASVDEAVKRLRLAKRPVIVVGHGARFAMQEVEELATELCCPVITTFKAKGQISDAHPSACGVLGRSGTPMASWFMNESDLMLVFGASFSNHTGITPKKDIIQVDYKATQLGRFHKVAVPVLGEVGRSAAIFLAAVAGKHVAINQRPEIAERWKIWRAEKLSRTQEESGKGANSANVFAALSELAPANAIIAVDVGNNAYSFGRYFECKNNSILMSGYLGSIGFGYPAAMGAWAATQGKDPRFQGRPVIAVTGDGGFGQYLAELQTAVQYKMNITHVLLNNGQLGKISKEQRAGKWPVWKTELHNIGFADYANSCGALGIRVDSNASIADAMKRVIEHEGPSMIEIMTDALQI